MDPLTHALAGCLVTDALPFTKRLGRIAPLAGALAGMVPDLDMAPGFLAKFPPDALSFHGIFDARLTMLLHRAYTHAFFYMALATLPLAYAAWRWSGRKGRLWQWALFLFPALCSHTLLDCLNRWGVRALLPFSSGRVTWGILPLTDWCVLGVTAVVFILNHVLRDSYPDEVTAAKRQYAWRERTAAWLDARVTATILGMAGVAVIVARAL